MTTSATGADERVEDGMELERPGLAGGAGRGWRCRWWLRAEQAEVVFAHSLTQAARVGLPTYVRGRPPAAAQPWSHPRMGPGRSQPERVRGPASQPAAPASAPPKHPRYLGYCTCPYGAPGTSASTRAAPPVIIATNQPGPGYLNACAGGHQQGLSAACPPRPQVPRTEKPAKAGHPLPLSSSTRPGRETLLLVSFSSHITAS